MADATSVGARRIGYLQARVPYRGDTDYLFGVSLYRANTPKEGPGRPPGRDREGPQSAPLPSARNRTFFDGGPTSAMWILLASSNRSMAA